MTEAAFVVSDLHKSYAGAPVLRGVNLRVDAGCSFGFAGANGAGKSTLLKCALNFIHYERGDIRFFGISARRREARMRLAFLPERFIPPYYLSGGQFLRMMMKLQGADFEQKAAAEMLESLDMAPAALNKPVRSFSKGMTQKIGLAACFLAGRDFYVFDEPMSGLDPKARALVKRRLNELKARGATIFFTSHALADIDEMCERVAVLHDGNICYEGKPADMRAAFAADTLEDAYLAAITRPKAG
ncbi:MAG: ABC transporter ATP-binding protein [Gammaproteobacteria bacterium]